MSMIHRQGRRLPSIVVAVALDCMQGKVLSGVFRQYGRRVRVSIRVGRG